MPVTGPSLTPSQAAAIAAVALPRAANVGIPTGMTVGTTTETAFSQKLTIPANTLAPGMRIKLFQWGRYTSTGVTPTITPRIRLGGIALFPDRAISGLIGTANSPWSADATFLVTGDGTVGNGLLVIDDNQVRIFGGPAVTGFNFATDLDLTSSAQWSATGNAITCQGWIAEVMKVAP